MTKEQLQLGIENIDEDLIDSVELTAKRRKKMPWMVSMAACFCMVIGMIAIMNWNKGKEVKATVNWTVVEQGEYYQISAVERNFGSAVGNAKSVQYNYVVYNGKYVLAAGISQERPVITQVNDGIVKVQWGDGRKERTTYCDLSLTDSDEWYDMTMDTEDILLETDTFVVYAYDDGTYCGVYVEGMHYEDDELGEVALEPGATDISATYHQKKNKISIQYVGADGERKTKNKKLDKVSENGSEIVENQDAVQCRWFDRMIESTTYDDVYEIDYEINREDAKGAEDEEIENRLYQYFIKANGTILDEGCCDWEVSVKPVEEDILVLYEDEVCLKFYRLSTGEMAECSSQVPFMETDGKIIDSMSKKEGGLFHTEVYDIFDKSTLDISAYQLKDVSLQAADTLRVTYLDETAQVKTKDLKLLHPVKDKALNLLKEESVGPIKKYVIGDGKKGTFPYYFYFIYNKEGEEILYYGYTIEDAVYLNQISDKVIQIENYMGGGQGMYRFYNTETEKLSPEYANVLATTEEKVVYVTYEEDGRYLHIGDMFGEQEMKYPVNDMKGTTDTFEAEIKGGKVILTVTETEAGAFHTKTKEFPLEVR